jgi:hypothetical protein
LLLCPVKRYTEAPIPSLVEEETQFLNYVKFYLGLYSHSLDLGRSFSFLVLYTVGRIPWTGDQSVARPLRTRRTQTQNKRTQTSMPRVGFEPTIPAFERAKTVYALDSTATVIGSRKCLGKVLPVLN